MGDKAFPMKQVSGNASYSQDPEAPAFPPEQLPPDSGNAHTASYGKEDVEILELQDIVPVGDSLPLLKKEFDSGSGRPREDSTFSESLQSRPIASRGSRHKKKAFIFGALGFLGIAISVVVVLLFLGPSSKKATVVLSSTAGAAEYLGDRMGEFVEAGEHGGRPFYTQRDTEGVINMFLYSEGGKWYVSGPLGGSGGWLRNKQDSPLPPSGTWEFWSSSRIPKGWQDDDTSLTL